MDECLTNILEHGWTVARLREALEGMPADAKVVFSYQYGDYWRTIAAEPVAHVEQWYVDFRPHNGKLSIVDEDRLYEQGDEPGSWQERSDITAVVVIS